MAQGREGILKFSLPPAPHRPCPPRPVRHQYPSRSWPRKAEAWLPLLWLSREGTRSALNHTRRRSSRGKVSPLPEHTAQAILPGLSRAPSRLRAEGIPLTPQEPPFLLSWLFLPPPFPHPIGILFCVQRKSPSPRTPHNPNTLARCRVLPLGGRGR